MTKNARGALALFLCSFFWGMAFSAQSNAMRHIGPYTFVFLRSTMTCAVLFLCLPFLHRLADARPRPVVSKARYVLIGGLCGTVLVAATILQQVGLVTTTPAKSGIEHFFDNVLTAHLQCAR